MNKKVVLFTFLLVAGFNQRVCAINLKQFVDKILDGRQQLITAIQSLKDGKTEISKIYFDQLKPQLFDVVDNKIGYVNGKIKDIKDALSPLTSIPSIVTKIVDIGDLESTLKWMIDNPLTKILDTLNNTKNVFQPIADQLIPPNPDDPNAQKTTAGILYANFDLAIAKLQSAVCKMEKTLTAMKAQFMPSPECAAPK